MNGSAPNCSATGSQVDVVRKWKPNFLSASEDPSQSCHPIKITNTTTASAIPSVSHSNALSPKRDGGAIARMAARGSTGNAFGCAATCMSAHTIFSGGGWGSGHVAEEDLGAGHSGDRWAFSRG